MNKELLYRQLKEKRTKTLNESIEHFFKESELNNKFIESYLQSEWKEIVGDVVAKYTSSIFVKNDNIILKIASAPLRNELLMNKKTLLQNIKNHLKTQKFKEIIFL